MRRKRLSLEPLEEPSINLTPLIDIVFVILISFMLLAPLLDIESIDLAASSPAAEKEQVSQHPFAISIRKDGSLWLRGKKVELPTLQTLLVAEKKSHPDLVPQLAPDKDSPFGIYQEVKNVIESAGCSEMELLLRPR